jgi:hypothetical protein
VKIRVAIFFVAMIVLSALPSWAGTIDFADCSTVTSFLPATCAGGGTNRTQIIYNSGIMATGYHYNGTSWNYTPLAIKNGGVNETGLGVFADPSGDDEITVNDAVSLDLGGYRGTGFFLNIGSLQSGESYQYCWSINANTGCTPIATGLTASSLWLTVPNINPFLYISASSGNVLVSSITIPDAQVPEPSSMLLLSSGLFGLAGIVRRKISR